MRAIEMGNYILYRWLKDRQRDTYVFFLMAMDIFCGIIWVIFRQIIGETTQIQWTRTLELPSKKNMAIAGDIPTIFRQIHI